MADSSNNSPMLTRERSGDTKNQAESVRCRRHNGAVADTARWYVRYGESGAS